MAVNDRISSMVQTDGGGGLIEFADRSLDSLSILFREELAQIRQGTFDLTHLLRKGLQSHTHLRRFARPSSC